ncbi:MAG: hypothetical protein M3Y55_07950 [Pseudomonadota bacterium]|nr:hypothetical protein [Pseudomonadota bacterium]
MKTYGMIVADNGSNWFVSGAPDDRWDNNALVTELRQVQGGNFEVLRMDGLVSADGFPNILRAATQPPLNL